jgi:hypothetical protein
MITPHEASQRLIDAIAPSQDRTLLEKHARLLIKSWADCGMPLDTTLFDTVHPPQRVAHAYYRKNRHL